VAERVGFEPTEPG